MKTRNTIALTVCALFATASLGWCEDAATATKPAAPKTTTTSTHHKSQTHLSKEDTMSIQNALAKSGEFKGTASGVWNKETTEALKAYQKANSLKITGHADKATLAKLGVTLGTASTTSASTTAK